MRVLESYQPREALRYFEEICSIPHGSRDTKRISDYCVRFAREHGLSYVQDEHNNVVICKPGTKGYEDHPPVILQGHLDMVCEKDADCDVDFSKDGLRLRCDGKYIFAEGTTLGGDDGIAVAYALAVLAADDLKHPPIEAVFTVDEEIGMLGADAMDMSVLKGRVLLNCDSEDEGILTVGCAGGATSTLTRPIKREAYPGRVWRIGVKHLTGGHSGVEINSGRANASKVLAAILNDLPVRLISIDGGSKDNAIPRSCEALVVSQEDLREGFARLEKAARDALPAAEKAAEFYLEPAGSALAPMTGESSSSVLALLTALPNGVQAMSADIPGLVQTSLNLGILNTGEDAVTMTFSVRSSVNAEKTALIEKLKTVGTAHGAAYAESGAYPAWEYRKDSPLRETMVSVFRELFGREPVVEAIHAGLECGIFSDRLPGLDAVSFGPQMHDIHTSRERLDLASTERTWKYLIAVLERL
ncbi:MAG: aminoacyl-histidine dipeptidase [Clostridia bacterium]|nr:aminoacyl-histidine dipeptidase [Oscillospiraceae bacterium]MBQ3763294.1 aminoacyl-histidine dipeptidase [Clostridia bacterium]